jgi:hypothetical protein
MKSARRLGDGMLAALGEDYARARSRGRPRRPFPKSVDAAGVLL